MENPYTYSASQIAVHRSSPFNGWTILVSCCFVSTTCILHVLQTAIEVNRGWTLFGLAIHWRWWAFHIAPILFAIALLWCLLRIHLAGIPLARLSLVLMVPLLAFCALQAFLLGSNLLSGYSYTVSDVYDMAEIVWASGSVLLVAFAAIHWRMLVASHAKTGNCDE